MDDLGGSIDPGRRWNRPGVPHRGWYCVNVYDDLDGAEYAEDGLSFACEMCGTYLRFVHVMQHPDYPNPMSVGCVCAEHMSEDYDGKARERTLKARIKQQKRDAALKEEERKVAEEKRKAAERWRVQVRETWLDPNNWKPAGGNRYGSIHANGFQVAVFKKGPDGWGFMIWWGRGNWPSRESFGTAAAAAERAIDSVIETSMRGSRQH